MSDAFDYINSINNNEKINVEESYSPFLTIRFFSYFIDTIHYANEANQFDPLKNCDMQYTYLLNSIKKKKRFTKWYKTEKDVDIENISAYYNCSAQRAREYQEILTREQLDQIYKWLNEKGE